MTEYGEYVRSEWKKFKSTPGRLEAAHSATAGVDVRRVLDIGCGAGQELIPYTRTGAFGVGIDLSAEVGIDGRDLFAAEEPQAGVAFVRGTAESLPFPSGSFDAIVCRVVLPYTDNRRAIGEMARVLSARGVLLLKIHHVRYYMAKFKGALRSGHVLSMVHAARVTLAGLIYHVSGRQVRHRLISNETFQTEWNLRRELARAGLEIRGRTADWNPLTPGFVIGKRR